MPRSEIHILLHVIVPAFIAVFFFPKIRFKTFVVLMLAMLIALTPLLAPSLSDPNRCSIGFHPLHTLPAVLVYSALIFTKKTRLFAVGLLIHIALDVIDCLWMRW